MTAETQRLNESAAIKHWKQAQGEVPGTIHGMRVGSALGRLRNTTFLTFIEQMPGRILVKKPKQKNHEYFSKSSNLRSRSLLGRIKR